MSSIETQVLPIIVAIIVAVSLHIVRGIFEETKEAISIVNSHRLDSLDKLALTILQKMQDDVERCLYLPEPSNALGEGYHDKRRCNTAKEIALMLLDASKKQNDLENVLNSWSNCEENGRLICNLGTFLNLSILVCVLGIIIFKPTQIVIDNTYVWIVISIIALPILCAFICYVFAFAYKRKFKKIRDR